MESIKLIVGVVLLAAGIGLLAYLSWRGRRQKVPRAQQSTAALTEMRCPNCGSPANVYSWGFECPYCGDSAAFLPERKKK